MIVAPTRLTAVLAERITEASHQPPSPAVRTVIRRAVLDTIGCAMQGGVLPWTEIAAAWVRRACAVDGTPSSTAWTTGDLYLRPSDAALIGGIAAHGFDFDDYHNAKLHPGAVVVPAALALAEAHGINGNRTLNAITIGYEVMIRASLALDPSTARRRGWHLTSVCGPLGAAAAAAVLLELDAETTASALGLAATQSAGLFAFTADGAMSKRFHAGRASSAGVVAAELAHDGFTGPTRVLDEIDGSWLRAFSDGAHSDRFVADWGTTWHAADINIKPYACCGSVHAYLDAALEVRRRLAGAPIDKVRAGLSDLVNVQCGFNYVPSTALKAQMSLRYCVAVALTDGAVLPEQFDDDHLSRADLFALASDIELVPDAELDALYPEHFAGWIEVTSGNRIERVFVRDPQGSSAAAVSDEALEDKFLGLVSARMGDATAHKLLTSLWAFEQQDPSELIGCLTHAVATR